MGYGCISVMIKVYFHIDIDYRIKFHIDADYQIKSPPVTQVLSSIVNFLVTDTEVCLCAAVDFSCNL